MFILFEVHSYYDINIVFLFKHLFEFIYTAHFHPELGAHFVKNIQSNAQFISLEHEFSAFVFAFSCFKLSRCRVLGPLLGMNYFIVVHVNGVSKCRFIHPHIFYCKLISYPY
jgi:hypothetical protein